MIPWYADGYLWKLNVRRLSGLEDGDAKYVLRTRCLFELVSVGSDQRIRATRCPGKALANGWCEAHQHAQEVLDLGAHLGYPRIEVTPHRAIGEGKVPVYDPGGLMCLVDDFVVQRPEDWSTGGPSLLREVNQQAKEQGAVQAVVVCRRLDEAKWVVLASLGLTVASEWYVAEL